MGKQTALTDFFPEMKELLKKLQVWFSQVTVKNCLLSLIGGMILGFGLMEIHSVAGITEGGALGLTLFLESWFDWSPAFTSLFFNALCYLFGIKMFGATFIIYSAISMGAFSLSYRIAESFPPLFPFLSDMPFVAAIAGAVFVGVSIGLCIRAGGAPTGDDALAMSLSKLTGIGIQWVYLVSDLLVIAMSFSYIPLQNVLCSLVTVILSGQIIALFQKKEHPKI